MSIAFRGHRVQALCSGIVFKNKKRARLCCGKNHYDLSHFLLERP